MSSLGKIFVFEKNAKQMHKFIDHLEAKGFITFGSDNIYQFLRYAKEINPDLIIMNMPTDFNATEQTWQTIEKSLCKESCPQIYINTLPRWTENSSVHYYEFNSSEDIDEEHIMDILNHMPPQKYFN